MKNEQPGNCYVACEALWHLLGGSASGWDPEYIRVDGGTHWFLVLGTQRLILDPTAAQFTESLSRKNSG